jgi:uncharacterized protein (UPF0335 family)
VDDLTQAKSRHTAATQKKARLEGQLKSKQDELRSLLDEIKEKGYDHKTLASTVASKRTELNAKLTTFTTELEAAEEQLAQFPD